MHALRQTSQAEGWRLLRLLLLRLREVSANSGAGAMLRVGIVRAAAWMSPNDRVQGAEPAATPLLRLPSNPRLGVA